MVNNKVNEWKKSLLTSNETLTRAIEVLNESGLGIALVVNKNKHLEGTITDGDIRRALLRQIGMNDSLTDVMQVNPVTALTTHNRIEILELMKSNGLLQIPLLDSNGCVVGLETLQHLVEPQKHENPIFLMAGGFGTRLHPLTKDIPKPMLKVGSKPILEIIITQFKEAGFFNFYISTHYKAEMLRDYFGNGSDWNVNIDYIHEYEPLGTAGALGLLPDKMPKLPIIMMNGDLLTKVNFEQLLAFHEEEIGLATMCIREYDFQVPYGVIDITENCITKIIEKPVHKFFVNAGIYVLEPEIVRIVNGQGYLDMPMLLEKQIEAGKKIKSFPIHEYWLDIGRMDEYERANNEVGNLLSWR